jgi:Gluconate 2-dehydrogenase subunit 3
MDRRTTLKWILAASASAPFLKQIAFAREPSGSLTTAYIAAATGYGTDPDLLKVYKSGELWPLTFTPPQRLTAKALSDLIIPADNMSPSASAVGVVAFLDEWISAPYETQQLDRDVVLKGFVWLDSESGTRFSKTFASLSEAEQRAICDDICYEANAKPSFAEAAKFFARYRDLTAGGFYTTPQGRKDLQYVGNTPMSSFEGPPLEVLKKVGLA